MSPSAMGPPLPLHKSFAAAAVAACTAELVSLPLDTAKVRLQVQGAGVGVPKYRGLVGTVGTIAREEGAAALWKGLVPSLHRQVLNGGLRVALYDDVKRALAAGTGLGDGLPIKVLAGLTTGAMAIAVANPTDLVKVRMQAEGKLAPGAARRYPSALAAYRTIARTEGVAALWTGLGPNVGRNAIVNASELASYDAIKGAMLAAGAADGVPVHVGAGLGAGFFAVVCGSPVDVIKSRIMANTARYSGVFDCAIQTFKEGGVPAFYKGFTSNFARLGTFNVALFLALEQARAFVRKL